VKHDTRTCTCPDCTIQRAIENNRVDRLRRQTPAAERDAAFGRVLTVLDKYRQHGHEPGHDAEAAKIAFIRAELAAIRAWLADNPDIDL